MGIDLGAPTGLQQLVGGTAGLLGSFLGRDPSKWDLKEGAYNGVKFHVLTSQADYNAALPKVSDSGGRRKIKYTFPYRDGQTTDDLGRTPRTYDLDCVIFGDTYKKALNDLVSQLEKATPGTLTHPVQGNVPAVVDSYTITHQSDQRKAAALRIVFIEHTFTIVSISENDPTAPPVGTIKSALMSALGALNAVSNALTAIQAAKFSVVSLKNQVTNLIGDYQSFFGNFLQNMNVSFNGGTSSDIPGLLPLNSGGTAGQTGATFPVAYVNSDPFAQLPINTNQLLPIQPITTKQANDQLNTLRTQATTIIQTLESANGGQGALQFYDEVLSIKQSAISAQDVLDTALAQSQFTVVEFVTPRLMSFREIAFAAGLTVDRVIDILTLNPTVLSTNFIPQGTTLTVPVS